MDRDIHILIATRKGASKSEHVVLEVTPPIRDWAREQGMDWTEKTLQAQLVGRWCEFEGWLYFDVGHAEESENIAPGQSEQLARHRLGDSSDYEDHSAQIELFII